MAKRKRSAFSCKSRSQRRPSPRLSASRDPPFTALSRQGGYAHILKGYFYTNLVGTPMMETIIASNLRPQSGFLCALLLSTVAFCGMLKGAHAQLYVTQLGNGPDAGSVGEYDAAT